MAVDAVHNGHDDPNFAPVIGCRSVKEPVKR